MQKLTNFLTARVHFRITCCLHWRKTAPMSRDKLQGCPSSRSLCTLLFEVRILYHIGMSVLRIGDHYITFRYLWSFGLKEARGSWLAGVLVETSSTRTWLICSSSAGASALSVVCRSESFLIDWCRAPIAIATESDSSYAGRLWKVALQ